MNEKEYKIGLSLSGGGAKGLAHIGVLQRYRLFFYTPNFFEENFKKL